MHQHGNTPLHNAASVKANSGLPMVQLLLQHKADVGAINRVSRS